MEVAMGEYTYLIGLAVFGLAFFCVASYLVKKENNKYDNFGNKILWKELCGIFGKDLITVRDKNYPDQNACTTVDDKNRRAPLCDYGGNAEGPDGCFQHYHEECFDLHECPMHPKKVNQMED